MTYDGARQRAEQLASGLLSAGVTPGERVAILSPNRPEILELYFGCARLGAVQVPLNAFLKGEFLRYQLDDSEASTLVVDGPGYRACEPLLDRLPNLERVVFLDEMPDVDTSRAKALAYEELRLGDGPCGAPLPNADAVMSIVYTSGTTGLPKGCVLTQGYYLRVARRLTEAWELHDDDVLFTALPLFHGAARMAVVAAALQAGSAAVIEPAFGATAFMKRAGETGATVVVGAGAMGMALLAQPSSPADRAHRLRLVVWIPFPADEQLRFEERFGPTTTAELFGQTECLPVTYGRLSAPRSRGTAGLPAPDLEVRLVDDADREVPVGTAGEIAIRPSEPYAMFSGYWRKPEATLNAMRNLWYHTGDYGVRDADGFISFVDRKKDALRRRGENVSSIELEAAITAHPKVSEAAVHAVPSAVTEDDIKACLVLAPGETVAPEELFAYLSQTIPYYAMPRYIEVLPELPKNAVFRVMKHLLRERGVTAETWDFDALGLAVEKSQRR
jgi:carnitine-CoA ligase